MNPGAPPLAALIAVEKVYGQGAAEVRALRGVNLTVHDGEFVAIIGASGSGKSTCMNVLGCLDVPTSGAYEFRGVAVGMLNADQLALLRRNYLGFVFQGFNLMARTSALENVELPLVYRGVSARERHARARAMLALVGLSDREKHAPSELSGGQQQRVAIARALVSEPAMLLADEPTGNLDLARTREIVDLLVRLNAERGVTIVLVTHEHDVAARAHRVVEFADGEVARDVAQSGEVRVAQ